MSIEAYKFRLYPTEEQKVLLAKHFGAVRFVYNWALDYHTKQYAQGNKYTGWMSLVGGGEFIKLKEQNPWLYEIGANTLINTVGHLDKAFQKFFRGQGSYPKFKSKQDGRQSFEIPSGLKIDFKHKKIQIPKFLNKKGVDNRIKFVLTRKVPKGKYGMATVSRNPSGEYYISFIIHTETTYPSFNKQVMRENSLGIDFGLKHFLTFSDGRTIDSPEFFKKALEKLKWEQHKLSRKQKDSKNKEKQRIKVARCHQHIANQRQDYLHNLTTGLVKESQFDVFCMEDLNLKGMSRLWGRKVLDLSYYTFQTMLAYKSVKFGKKVIKIGRFEPSTQICSRCGHRHKMKLDERIYICPECGLELDRDVNAAINIRNFALRDLLKNTDATSGMNACGVEGSGSRDASLLNETIDSEAGKFEGLRFPQSQSSSVAG